jgi:7-carboxy-7-deazaguanine synthase (Cx14CxxC type)
MYKIKEIFPTLQGEGYWTGRAAVFVRFAGCNLWNGREEDRSSAVCKFCDTDFIGGENLGAIEVCRLTIEAWSSRPRRDRFCVLTGGEPTLQLDYVLAEFLRRHEFFVAIETNGTRKIDGLVDWITVSPKAGTDLVQTKGDELKLVYPQEGAEPERFDSLDFKHFFIQPMDGLDVEANTQAALAYCMANPQWRLSTQTHKVVGIR